MNNKLMNNYEVLLAILEAIKSIPNNSDETNTKLLQEISGKIDNITALPDEKIDNIIQVLQELSSKTETSNNIQNNFNIQVNNICNVLINNILKKKEFKKPEQPNNGNGTVIIDISTDNPNIEHIKEMLNSKYEYYCYKGGLHHQCCKPLCSQCTIANECEQNKKKLLCDDCVN